MLMHTQVRVFNYLNGQYKKEKDMNNMIGKKTIWTLSMAACVLIAIAVVRANEVKTDPIFSLDHSPISRVEGANALSYSAVVKKVRPSIVSISTSKTVQVSPNIFNFGFLDKSLILKKSNKFVLI